MRFGMILMLSFATLAVPACSEKAATLATPTEAASATAIAVAPPAPPAPPTSNAAARKVVEENDIYDFAYAYPAAAAAIPALRDLLDKDLEKQKTELMRDARDGQKDAKQSGYPFNAYSTSTDWQVVTDLPGWLSMSTILGSYTGGAHPNYVFDTILWDKAVNRRQAPIDLFTSKAALSKAIRADFCAALNKQRAQKRGEPVPAGSTEMFEECIDPVDSTVILGSADKQGFDRIGVLVPPYEAGPYAEGSYEVTLPVTAAVLAVVKPEYRNAFRVH